MKSTTSPLLGCRVTDVQTGETLGWVKNTVFDPQGEQVTELLVDPSARRKEPPALEHGERLLGQALVDSNSRYLGQIVDVVVGVESGLVHGLMIERTPGQADYVPAYQGLVWEQGHWVLIHEAPVFSTTWLPEQAEAPLSGEVGDDWMIGQIATVRLTDRQGQVIIQPGERITATTIEQASRAGVLHRLEGQPE